MDTSKRRQDVSRYIVHMQGHHILHMADHSAGPEVLV